MEYAKFLSEEGKIYMVKGLNCNLDKVLDTTKVPYMINTHLLMFENNIIYNESTESLTIGGAD